MKKTGVPFYAGIDGLNAVDANGNIVDTDISANIIAEYKLESADNTAWQATTDPALQIKPGSYNIPFTLNTAGVYDLAISSSNDDFETMTFKVTVQDTDIDDVSEAVTVLQSTLDAVKTQVDVLDEQELNNVNEIVTSISAKLTDLTALVGDETDNSITSLKELLLEIQNAGASRDSVITALSQTLTDATDDIEAMIRGDEKLSDGVTDNPFFGNTNIDVHTTLKDLSGLVSSGFTSLETNLKAAITTAKDTLVAEIDDVQAIVDSNKLLLEDGTVGLGALKTKLNTIATTISDNDNGVTQQIDDLAAQLGTVSTNLTNKLNVMDGKLDTVIKNQTRSVRIASEV